MSVSFEPHTKSMDKPPSSLIRTLCIESLSKTVKLSKSFDEPVRSIERSMGWLLITWFSKAGTYMITPDKIIKPQVDLSNMDSMSKASFGIFKTVQSVRNIQLHVNIQQIHKDWIRKLTYVLYATFDENMNNLARLGGRASVLDRYEHLSRNATTSNMKGFVGDITSSKDQHDSCRTLLETDLLVATRTVFTQWVFDGISLLTKFEWIYIEFRNGTASRGYGWNMHAVVPGSTKVSMPFFEMVKVLLVPTL